MTRQLTIFVPIALLGALLFGTPANAQRGFGGRAAPSGRSGSGRSFATNGSGAFRYARGARSSSGFRHGGWGRGYGLGWDYLPNPYFEEGGEDYARPDYEAPMPPPQAMYEPPEPAKLIQPILIERQGNDWVQVTGYKEAPASGQIEPAKSADAMHPRATLPGEKAAAEPATAIPPAVLVFRDGHQEEVKSYTIIGSTLYAKADYWAGGAWSRKIHIASLDVPATMKLNQEHGSQFRLPSGPQEIMIRP
jgi:hypothetical protein